MSYLTPKCLSTFSSHAHYSTTADVKPDLTPKYLSPSFGHPQHHDSRCQTWPDTQIPEPLLRSSPTPWQQMSNLTWHPNTWAPPSVIPNTMTADVKPDLTPKYLSPSFGHPQHHDSRCQTWPDTQIPEPLLRSTPTPRQQMSNLTWHPNTWAPPSVIPNTTTADVKPDLTPKYLSPSFGHPQHHDSRCQTWPDTQIPEPLLRSSPTPRQQTSKLVWRANAWAHFLVMPNTHDSKCQSWVDTQKPEVVPNIPWWHMSKLGWWNGSAREPGGIRTAATLESDHRLCPEDQTDSLASCWTVEEAIQNKSMLS